MAGAGKKTFTAGEVLTASDVNTYLMEQSVMVFGGTAARSSAIPTPSAGMTSYISTTGTASIPQIETYTGSQWQTPYGLTLLNSTTISAQSSVQINNVFSSIYDYYNIVWEFKASSYVTVSVQLALNGTPASGVNYQQAYTYSTTSAGPLKATGTFDNIPIAGAHTSGSSGIITITQPAKAQFTGFIGQKGDFGGTELIQNNSAIHTLATAYDGIRFFASSAFSGTLKIYGYRN